MSINITGHYPTINASGVFRNEPIRIYFDNPIEASTFTWNTISVQDKDSFSTVVGELGTVFVSSGVCKELTFTPSLPMLPTNEYSVYVYGAPDSVVGKDGSQLEDSYTFSFITGTGYYTSTGVAGVPSGVDSGEYSVTLSGINPTDINDISSFTIYSTTPKNYQPNVDLMLSGIQIVFTGTITSTSREIQNLITLDEEEVL